MERECASPKETCTLPPASDQIALARRKSGHVVAVARAAWGHVLVVLGSAAMPVTLHDAQSSLQQGDGGA